MQPPEVPLESVSLGDEPTVSAPPEREPVVLEPTPEPTSAPTLEPRSADDDSVEVPVETTPTAPAPKTLDLFEDEPQEVREVSAGGSGLFLTHPVSSTGPGGGGRGQV